jgi:hypothetical protein
VIHGRWTRLTAPSRVSWGAPFRIDVAVFGLGSGDVTVELSVIDASGQVQKFQHRQGLNPDGEVNIMFNVALRTGGRASVRALFFHAGRLVESLDEHVVVW